MQPGHMPCPIGLQSGQPHFVDPTRLFEIVQNQCPVTGDTRHDQSNFSFDDEQVDHICVVYPIRLTVVLKCDSNCCYHYSEYRESLESSVYD